MATIGMTLETTAARVPERTAIVSGELRLTYREFNEQVNRVAALISEQGLRKGDRCGFIGKNCEGFIFVLYAVQKLGAIFVPINPHSAAPELTHILKDSGAAILIAERDSVAVSQKALASMSGLPLPRFFRTSAGEETEDLLGLAITKSSENPGIEVKESDDAILMYTSGTTGLAKGVLMDHHRLIWTGISIPVATAGMVEGASLLHVAPLYHAGQTTMMLLPGTLLGAKHVILSKFDPVAVLDTMEAERTTAFFGTPTMLHMVLQAYSTKPRDLSAWEMAIYGAAPMPTQLAAQLQEDFSTVRIYSCYGQTEAGPNGFFSSPAEVRARPDVTGYRAFPGMEARVVDANGEPTKPGEVGEVLLRGESVMKGYWNNPTATASALQPDGWLHTGDLARLDADGGMTIVDRLKDMIISGGRNIYSAEVENAISSHPGVADVAVLARAHDVFGETVVAVVTVNPAVELTLEGLRAHCAELISDYKLPRELILADIPRNPSGKILKHVLRSELKLTQRQG